MITKQPDPSLSVTTDQLLKRAVVNNALYMAGQEMASIKELDYDFYHTHVSKFIIYFSPEDYWAPKQHYEDMKSRFPNGNNQSADLSTSFHAIDCFNTLLTFHS